MERQELGICRAQCVHIFVDLLPNLPGNPLFKLREKMVFPMVRRHLGR